MPRSANPAAPGINLSRLQTSIDRLAAAGATRLAYTEDDIRGRNLTIEMMRALDLSVRIDAAGNIFGRRAGAEDLPPIVFGSHVDTVRGGGKYDGVLGVMAGIECMRVLFDKDLVTLHPLEIVVFANEEGQRFGALCGSRGAVGKLSQAELDSVDGTETLRDAIRAIGGRPEDIDSSALEPGAMTAYIELHIEQGGELERLGAPIGVVQGISGIQHVEVVLSGAANHSGTTTMTDRQDSLVAASALILAVRHAAAVRNLCRVATVGQLTVSPNSINIVPGEVRLMIELRDLDADRIHHALSVLQAEAREIALRHGVCLSFQPRKLVAPTPCDTRIIAQIEKSCMELGLDFHRMPSGAGHDAQMIASIAPMGMIFVPSVGGISHSTKEFTTDEHCAQGAAVLLHTILGVDRLRTHAATGVSTE